jgi:glycosyltransferase involved in cell wall biosynthesis
MKKLFLSIVIIAKNEEERVGKCLDSIMKLKRKYSLEIIFIDSASTDKTIEIVSKYPVKIYQLNKSKYLNPSAGRYIGTSKAKGEYILFIDGDSILIEGFVEKALKVLEQPDVATVSGERIFITKGGPLKIKRKFSGKANIRKTIGGTGVYKREIIKKSGTFNPYMGGQEERELCFRIRKNGYKIMKIDTPMEYHINKDMDMEESNEKAGYFIGVGQIIRKYGLKSITWDLLYAQRKALIETTLIVSAFIWLILNIFFRHGILLIGGIIILAGILLLFIYKNPVKVFVFVISRFKLFISIIKGFFKGIPEAQSFDKKVKIRRLK